ncbi:hypothetical protein SDC9_20235 [bioreactor metagenome]|uniref:Uncharacterized protein n=1 Tax=bioreactor metagenome TaxID=1076179 RepID=A0A644U643_9ZZZZ
MITTKIHVHQHLAEYIIGKYGIRMNNPVTLPDNIPLYHFLWDLMSKRPEGHAIDTGNVELVLPDRRDGKNPRIYNYISARGAKLLQFKIETMLWTELHDELDHNKHRLGVEYIDTIHIFCNKYNITGISEDAMLKNYYRWRNVTRRRNKEKRSYTRQNQ